MVVSTKVEPSPPAPRIRRSFPVTRSVLFEQPDRARDEMARRVATSGRRRTETYDIPLRHWTLAGSTTRRNPPRRLQFQLSGADSPQRTLAQPLLPEAQ